MIKAWDYSTCHVRHLSLGATTNERVNFEKKSMVKSRVKCLEKGVQRIITVAIIYTMNDSILSLHQAATPRATLYTNVWI